MRKNLARFVNGKPNEQLQRLIDTAPNWVPRYEEKIRKFMFGNTHLELQPKCQRCSVERG